MNYYNIMITLDNLNEIENNINEKVSELQDFFLNTKIGGIANSAIDFGIKFLLPDQVEEEVIEIKDALINGGIKECVFTALSNSITLGRETMGLDEKSFNSIEEAQNALEKGDLINGLSSGLDLVFNKLENLKIIDEGILNKLKDGKNNILNNFDSGLKNEFENEIKNVKKIEKYIESWKKSYMEKDIEKLNKQYNKIEKIMKTIMPLDNLIKNINMINNVNELINNSKNFDFDEMYLKLADCL